MSMFFYEGEGGFAKIWSTFLAFSKNINIKGGISMSKKSTCAGRLYKS